MAHNPAKTAKGNLPPCEVAKAIAIEQTFKLVEKRMKQSCFSLMGESRAAIAARQVKFVGGGHPTERAIKKHWAKATKDKSWYPGKPPANPGGRPPQISEAQKKAIAQTAMQLKKQKIAPSPQAVRTKLPRKTINKVRKAPISDRSIQLVFKTLCYDEKEDDKWQHLASPQQDCLTDDMKPGRVKTAQHVIDNITENAAFNMVAIDPCYSLLPTHQQKADLLNVAAMGNKKWMSKGSKRKGVNLRAPRTAKTQREGCTMVPWTPVFTRGRLKLVVLTHHKAKFNKSTHVASFVQEALPKALEQMKKKWGWSNIPRVLLHDKASYFVNNKQNNLNRTFAAGLRAGRFTSWVDSAGGDCAWLARNLGDYYSHETGISHVRRLLSTTFVRHALHETPNQFAARMQKVENHLNKTMGKGTSLMKLGCALHTRSRDLKKRKGERLPK